MLLSLRVCQAGMEQSGRMEPATRRVREAREFFTDRVSQLQRPNRSGCPLCAVPASDRTRSARRAEFREESRELGVAKYRKKKCASQPGGDSRRGKNPPAGFTLRALDCCGRASRIEERRG